MTAPGSQFPRWLPAQPARACVLQLSSSELSQSPTNVREASFSDSSSSSSSSSVTTIVQRFVANSSDSCSADSMTELPPPPPPRDGPPSTVRLRSSFAPIGSSSSECIVAYQMLLSDLRQPELAGCDNPVDQPQPGRSAKSLHCAYGHCSRHVITEFEKNWTSSPESSTEQHCQLVTKFARPTKFIHRNAINGGAFITGSSGGDAESNNRAGAHKASTAGFSNSRSFPAWCGLPEAFGNVSNNPTAAKQQPAEQQPAEKQPAEQQKPREEALEQQSPDQQQQQQEQTQENKPSTVNPSDEPEQSCLASCSVLRCVGLCLYYLLVWAVAAGLTWLLLNLTLRVTSKGRFPYYMGPHSFCLTGTRLGFPGGNPELGKEAKFRNLTDLADKLSDEIEKIFNPSSKDLKRPYRKCEGPETTDTAELMKPCNLSAFVKAAKDIIEDILTKTPAVLLQMKRRLAYLPASGPAVKIKCKVNNGDKDLPLTYYSWWGGSAMNESSDFGSIPTKYFPMLTRQHNVPGVLVAVKKDTDWNDWYKKTLVFTCRPSDGSKGESPKRELILQVGS